MRRIRWWSCAALMSLAVAVVAAPAVAAPVDSSSAERLVLRRNDLPDGFRAAPHGFGVLAPEGRACRRMRRANSLTRGMPATEVAYENRLSTGKVAEKVIVFTRKRDAGRYIVGFENSITCVQTSIEKRFARVRRVLRVEVTVPLRPPEIGDRAARYTAAAMLEDAKGSYEQDTDLFAVQVGRAVAILYLTQESFPVGGRNDIVKAAAERLGWNPPS